MYSSWYALAWAANSPCPWKTASFEFPASAAQEAGEEDEIIFGTLLLHNIDENYFG
jgi:hypothetical protein